jgi:hypothetical protein
MILDMYAPQEFTPNTEQEYVFTFEHVGPTSIEVYEVDDLAVRTLIPASGYNIRLKPDRAPLYGGGVIEFTRDHLPGTVRIFVERNTRIVQLLDFNQVEPFPARMIEFALDYRTIVFQELVTRKCTAFTSTPITQEMTFATYGNFPAEALTSAVEKLYLIAREISDTAADCRETPELT